MYDKSKGLLTAWRLAQTAKVPALTWRYETVKVEAVKVWMLQTVSMPIVGPGRPCPYCGRLDCICGKRT